MAEHMRKDVAVFIDFENIYVSVRDKLDANPNFEIIMDRCNELGRVILARAFADWYRYPRITSALYANNIEPIYVPTYYYDKDAGRTGRPIKNSVDMNLCIDAMRTLFTMPQLSTFVLITGDRDFIPLVNSIRQQGKDVIIIGVGGAASTHLAQSADEFIFYEHLVGKPLPQVAQPGNGRRISDVDEFERDRSGRERTPQATRSTPVITKAERKPVALSEDQVFALLCKAVVEARSRNMLTAFGSLKVLMRELSNGEFREQLVRDVNGKPIERFKDFVHEAARRGVVMISSDGVVNEVFLPGEDPATVSQFTNVETATGGSDDGLGVPAVAAAVVIAEEPDLKSAAPDKQRRRRRRGDRAEEVAAVVATPVATVPVDTDDLVIVGSNPVGIAPAPEVSEVSDEGPSSESVPFSDEERKLVRAIVAASARPMSFQQIYDALRGGRNRGGAQQPPRTNEELRSLVKLSINSGELLRIGRGNRVSYRLPQVDAGAVVEAVAEPVADDASVATLPAVHDDDLVAVATAVEATPAEDGVSVAAALMIPTPEDHEDALQPPLLNDLMPVAASVAVVAGTADVETKSAPKKRAATRKSPAKKSTTSRTPAAKASSHEVASAVVANPADAPALKKPVRRRTAKKSEGEG